ncbi:MAG: hypothetical protein IRY85_05865 [Micromonosporaceae bacterium]|nr:hypothetical protein [Micromonosporaceae bacterium]
MLSMVSRRLRVVPVLVVGAVLATAFVVLGPARPAYACNPVTDPYCEGVEIEDPGHPGGGSGGPGGPSHSGPCYADSQYGRVEVPCYDDDWGAYDGNNCWWRPAPEHKDPEGEGEQPGMWYRRYCISPHGSYWIFQWVPDGAAPRLTPEQLARRALASVRLLPADIQMAPDPSGSGLVGLPVWMWTTVNPNTWGPISATDSDAGLTVTITARAASIAWDMGDGHTVICDNPGTPYEPRFGNRTSPTCGHVYTTPSRDRPGGVFPVTATTTWRITWSGGGESGVFTVLRQSQTSVSIGELQVVTE